MVVMHERAPSREASSENEVIKNILAEAIVEQDKENPRLFRVLMSYGSKQLQCFVHKKEREAGAIIEAVRGQERKNEETTMIYKALSAFLRGVANRYGESMKYVLRTEDKKLIAWAQEKGNDIFSWTSIQIKEGDIAEFACTVAPDKTPRQQEKEKRDQEAKILIWESRNELRS